MLFNTFSFFLVFLPLALTGYLVLARTSHRLSILFLLVASIVFYIYWDSAFLPLILGSILVNYLVGRWISQEKEAGKNRRARLALIVGLVFNLGLLGFFKYADFFVAGLAWLSGSSFTPFGIALPIGISFFTFTQIAYLVDCHTAAVREYKAENYGLFVTYFPHLIAGPILHHKDMMPQFDKPGRHDALAGRLVIGMLFFVIGLFKKVVLADGIAPFVAPVFDVNSAYLTALEAWCGAFAYTFQLYFDFSAYCDMAYGLSYLFGVILPINFNSPYKARSIIDFWRRWHITLSIFLRQYLYIPLGGNRHGRNRRYLNLIVTMLLGGLWHGANATFVVWGALHGFYLVLNHAFARSLGMSESVVVRYLGWLATFLAVVVAWVFFRANSVPIALDVLRAMVGGNDVLQLPNGLLGINRIMQIDQCLAWLGGAALVAFCLPNAYQTIGFGRQFVRETHYGGMLGGVIFGAAVVAILVLLSISETRGVSEFLYFNF